MKDDAISRQAAIDALARTAREAFNLSDEYNQYLAGLMDGESAIRQLPSAQPEPTLEQIEEYCHKRCLSIVDNALLHKYVQPEQQWIPCSERLPDEKDAGILKKLGIEKMSEDVLATVDIKGERMTVTACTYDGEWIWDMKYTFPDFKVVAWMPLPKPYKGES